MTQGSLGRKRRPGPDSDGYFGWRIVIAGNRGVSCSPRLLASESGPVEGGSPMIHDEWVTTECRTDVGFGRGPKDLSGVQRCALPL